MACGCGPKPPIPWVRPGLPTVWAWGPFANHEVIPYEELEAGDQDEQLVVG